MYLGESLVEAGLIKPEHINLALDRQRKHGGTLGESLVILGCLTIDELDSYFNFSVPTIKSIEDTGLDTNFLLSLMLKIMHVYGHESATTISQEIKLPMLIVQQLMDIARERSLVESSGSSGSASASLTAERGSTLSKAGKQWAAEAMTQSQYAGPAPVTIEAYQQQTEKQRIGHDRVDRQSLQNGLSHLVLPDDTLSVLGPALNFSRAMMFHGPSGNGKSSISAALARSFQQFIYVPYAICIHGQVINVFDPEIHTRVDMIPSVEKQEKKTGKLKRNVADQRWIRCRRPIAVTGSELTLEMLDLNFNEYARYYEAPLQVKATGGIFIIDDFGRQDISASKILNRWVAPLERGFDYLTLNTGKKFPIRFDGVVIFVTNLPPADLMDPAMLRRIPYNFEIKAPTDKDYETIFKNSCQALGVKYREDDLKRLLSHLYDSGEITRAAFHPKFMLDHILARCRYEGRKISLDDDLMIEAAGYLSTRSSS